MMKLIKTIPFLGLFLMGFAQAQNTAAIERVNFELSRDYAAETQLHDEIIHSQIQESLKYLDVILNGPIDSPVPIPYIAEIYDDGYTIIAFTEIIGENNKIQKLRVEIEYGLYNGFLRADIKISAVQVSNGV